MARPLRIEFAGAIYHITSRGNARSDIYLDDHDRHVFLELLGLICGRFNWCCHAYCLMTNHYHLVIETGDATLAKGMRQLNGIYTQQFNRHHQRIGHVFQGRYKAILVDKDNYLLEVIRYVLLNPVRAYMTTTAGQYRWSSYRSMIGKAAAPGWLAKDRVLSQFAKHSTHAQKRFIAFMKNGKGQTAIWENLINQLYLGDEKFVIKMQGYHSEGTLLDEIPRIQKRPPAKSLSYYEKHYTNKEAMGKAYDSGNYTLKEIAEFFGVHYSTVSRAVNRK